MRNALLLMLMAMITLSCNRNIVGNRIIIGSVRDDVFFSAPKVYAVDDNGKRLSITRPFVDAVEANWSPDSQWVVYQTVQSIDPQIFIMKMNGKDSGYLLTSSTFRSGRDPAWSPNGDEIAVYLSNVKNQNGIYIVNVACIITAQSCQLDYRFIVHGRMPSWSPDGKQLAFWSDDQIFVVSIDTPSDIRRITPKDMVCLDPAWSPIGDEIAVRCFVPFQGKNIFLVNSDGSNFRNITNSKSQDLMPTWSPDGTKIAFVSDRAADLGKPIINVSEGIYSDAVFIMNSDGKNVKRVSPYNNESIDWIDWIGP